MKILKKIVLIFAASVLLCLLAAAGASAQGSGICGDNLTWTIDDEGNLTISGSGEMYDYTLYTSTQAPWKSENPVNVTIEDGVTSIGEYAFYRINSIKSVTVGRDVKSVGTHAFHSATNMEYLYWNAVKADDFSVGSSNLIFDYTATAGNGLNVVFGSEVEHIPAYMFKKYHEQANVVSVTFGGNEKSIGKGAFVGCVKLTEIEFPKSVAVIGANAFQDTKLTSVTIPESVTSIGERAFSGCADLEEIYWKAVSAEDFINTSNVFAGAGTAGSGIKLVFGDSAERVPAYFCYVYSGTAPNIASVAFGKNVKEIGSYAFYGANITELDIPESVETIKSRAFYKVAALERVILGSGTKTIGQYAFADTNIISLTVSESVTSIGERAFSGCSYLEEIYWNAISADDFANTSCVFSGAGENTGGVRLIFGDRVERVPAYLNYDYYNKIAMNIVSVTFGGNVKEIGSYAFYGANITELDIPYGVETIQSCAFYKAASLERVILGNGTKTIERSAFADTNIISLTVPESVTSIGKEAFSGCVSLAEIYWNAISANGFSYNTNVFAGAGTAGSGIRIVFGDSVERVPANFGYVSSGTAPNIVSVAFGGNVKQIGSYAFYGANITELDIPESVEAIRSYAFCKAASLERVILGSGTKTIEGYAFAGTNIISLTVPESLTSIGERAFSGCSYLEEIYWNAVSAEGFTNTSSMFAGAGKNTGGIKLVFGDSVERVPAYFCYVYSGTAPNIASVTFGGSIKQIGNYAFCECAALKSVKIPDSVSSLGKGAFSGCTSLESVTLGGGIEAIGDYVFSGCAALKNVKIPDSIASLGDNAFEDCTSLESVTLGEGIKTIGQYAFSECGALKKIAVPSGVTALNRGVFQNCASLERVTLYNTLKSVGSATFDGCDALCDVYYSGDEDEWSLITISTYNEPLTNAAIHYNSTGENGRITLVTAILLSGNINVTAYTENLADENVLIAISYDSENAMIEAKIMEDGRAKFSQTGVAKVRVFLWESRESMKPLCGAKERAIK